MELKPKERRLAASASESICRTDARGLESLGLRVEVQGAEGRRCSRVSELRVDSGRTGEVGRGGMMLFNLRV